MRTRLMIAAVTVTAAVLAVAGCSGNRNNDDNGGELPDPGELLSTAADEMAGLQTIRLQLESDTDLGSLALRQADAVVTADGDAAGTGEVEVVAGQAVELDFVMVGDSFHYRGLLGPRWLELPRDEASSVYDPSAILDPDRGVANLLRNAQDPKVTGTETVAGVETYVVTATFAGADVAAVLPGVTDSLPGTLWIGVDRPLLHQAEFDLEGGTVTVTLSEFDEPVQIDEPT